MAKKPKPVIISTGMSKISEIDEAVGKLLDQLRKSKFNFTTCNSSYPSTYSQSKFKIYDTLGNVPNTNRFSDHTTDLLASKLQSQKAQM